MRSISQYLSRSRLVLVLVFALHGCGSSPTGPGDADFSVLFIGNSLTYTNNLPATLERLLKTTDLGSIHVEAEANPNFGLVDHWNLGRASKKIAEGGWDVVIMQQGPSATEGRPSLLEYSRRFAEQIRDIGAKPGLFMVWPSTARSFDFDGVSESYRMAADSVDGLLFPAGEAWRAAWRRAPSTRLYGSDGFHPSPEGSYLAALVMFGQLANTDPRNLPLDAGKTDLPQSTVRVLQQAAAEANETFSR